MNIKRKRHVSYWRWSKIFLKTFRILSYMPFQEINDGGDIDITYQSWIYSIFAAAVQVTIAYLSFNYRVHTPHFWEDYVKVLDNLIRFVCCITVPHLMASWSSTPLLINYVKEWQSFEKGDLPFDGRFIASFKPWIIKCVLFAFGIFIVLLLILDQYLSENIFAPWLFIPYFCALFHTISLVSCWTCNCVVLANTVKCFRHHLVKTLNGCPKAGEVRRVRLLWVRLQHLATQLPVVFGAPLFIQLVGHFFIYVLAQYSFIRYFTVNEFAKVYLCGLTCVWCIVIVISVNESSYYLASQIGIFTLTKVLSIRTQSLSIEARKEIHLLIDSIKDESNLELLGYTTLGRATLLRVAKMGISYMVVLTQFDSGVVEALANIDCL